MFSYRVNFGNGQVHYAGDRVKCLRFVEQWGDGSTFLQRRDFETGEWFKVRTCGANDLQ